MENCFLTCCHDSVLIGTRSECDRLQCQGNQDPVFNVFYHKVNNEYFYCFNRNQLGQYWKCVVEDRDFFCSSRCDRCSICKEMSDVFSELQDSYFLYPKTTAANNYDEIPYQPVLWRIFTSTLNKRNERFRIDIAKLIPNTGLVLDFGETRSS